MSRPVLLSLVVLLVVALFALAACAAPLPRTLRERLYGPDPSPTPRLRLTPTARPGIAIPTAIAPGGPARPGTPTPAPSHTPTPTRTATPTPALERLTLQQGTTWYDGKQLTEYRGVQDTFISDWNRAGAPGQGQTLSVRQGEVMATLIYFDLSALPSSAEITSAELGLFVSSRSNETTMTLSAYRMLRAWQDSAATWSSAATGSAWEVAGARGATDHAAQPVAQTTVANRAVWVTLDVTDPVKRWIANPQENRGLLIAGQAANAVQYDFFSSQAQDMRRRPRLALSFPTGAIALSPPKVATPTPSATATPDRLRPETINLARLLPLGSSVLARAASDIGRDGPLEVVAAYRAAGESGVHVAVFHSYGETGDYRLYWNSLALATGRAGATNLDVVDITGDGEAEILLSVGPSAAERRSLYVFTGRPITYRMLSPVGGLCAGQDHFGDDGYSLAGGAPPTDSAQVGTRPASAPDILARCGQATQVYRWDGVNFVAAPAGP